MKKLAMRTQTALTVQEAHDNFIRKCTVRNLSEKTIAGYKIHFQAFKRFLGGEDFPVSEIASRTIDDFVFYLKENHKCNDVSINSYLRSIRAFLNVCMDEGHTKGFKIKMLKVNKEIKETYTDSELKTLLKKPNIKTCSFSEYKIWALSNYLLGTGNRISSALNIKIGDLDFSSGVIQVNKTKNRKAQIIPMSTALANVLRDYLTYRKGDTDDYLFCNTYGGKPDQSTFQEMIRKYNRQHGVSKTSAHLYRHTFAKKWILNGGDIFRLQKILGHSDLSVVKEYVNMFGNDLSMDFNRFNPLDNMDCSHTREKIKL